MLQWFVGTVSEQKDEDLRVTTLNKCKRFKLEQLFNDQ
jgi:hypothetical protein